MGPNLVFVAVVVVMIAFVGLMVRAAMRRDQTTSQAPAAGEEDPEGAP